MNIPNATELDTLKWLFYCYVNFTLIFKEELVTACGLAPGILWEPIAHPPESCPRVLEGRSSRLWLKAAQDSSALQLPLSL